MPCGMLLSVFTWCLVFHSIQKIRNLWANIRSMNVTCCVNTKLNGAFNSNVNFAMSDENVLQYWLSNPLTFLPTIYRPMERTLTETRYIEYKIGMQHSFKSQFRSDSGIRILFLKSNSVKGEVISNEKIYSIIANRFGYNEEKSLIICDSVGYMYRSELVFGVQQLEIKNRRKYWNKICYFLSLQFPTAQVAAQTPNTLPALTALISSLCSGSPSCYDTIVTIVSSLVALLVNALNLRDLAPGTNCLQIILNIILRLVNAILALINCLAQVLLTTLQTAQTNCCQVLTALVNTIVTLLINVVDNLVDLLSAVLSALGVSVIFIRNDQIL